MTLKLISLKVGAHQANGEACVMEAAAYVAGAPWSDSPECVSKVIGRFMRSLNDSLATDADRVRLLAPLIEEILGTAAPKDIEDRRSWMALDWLIREHTPPWMDLTESLKPHAAALRGLPEVNAKTIRIIQPILDAARAAAWDAAWDAAGDAAWAAARDAARVAARAAAGAAGWAAARDAGWAAARDAARDALAPITTELQASAQNLVRRMAALHRAQFKPVRAVQIGDILIGAES